MPFRLVGVTVVVAVADLIGLPAANVMSVDDVDIVGDNAFEMILVPLGRDCGSTV